MNQQHILLVEDEVAVAKILRIKLEEAGFQVTVAVNGKEGLDRLADGGVDLILLDLLMPVMNGFQVLEALQKKQNSTPVIVLTNLGQKDDIEQIQKFGPIDYLIKSDTPLTKILEQVNAKLQKTGG
jgi:CheY-like chemotaxis protein